jgi:hypothetical protein
MTTMAKERAGRQTEPEALLLARARSRSESGSELIPVIVTTTIEDELKPLQAERDENIERTEFTPDEALVMRALFPAS